MGWGLGGPESLAILERVSGRIQFLPPSISPRVSPSSPVNAVRGVGLYAMPGGGHEGDGGLVRLGEAPTQGPGSPLAARASVRPALAADTVSGVEAL